MIRFGTGGWRAIIADEFTKSNVRLLAQGLANRMHDEQVTERGLIIGYDRRFLSREAAWWVTDVMVANGIPVTIIDRPAPSPMIMWTTKNRGTAYGLAVTASHNPALYNGIKVFTEGGRDAEQSITDALADQINQLTDDDIRSVGPDGLAQHELVTVQRSMNWYIDSILDQIDTELIRHAHLKVVLDPMFGVSQTCLQTILMTARCDVDVINSRHDTLFGGRLPSPDVAMLHELSRTVVENNAQLGIATDGDADRLGIIDDQGNYLSANQILVLLYRYLVTKKGWNGPAVRNIATTHMLDRVAEKYGQKCYEVPVGFKHISAKMAETDAVIGGESSGGLTVRGHIAGKDGVYAASLLVEMLAASGRRLSELWGEVTDEFGTLEMDENAYGFTAERREELQQRVFEKRELPDFGYDVDHVSYDDGCKVYFTNGGWVVIRFSGTEPVIRVFSEMETLEQAEQNCSRVEEFLGLA